MADHFHKMHGLGNDFVVIDAREKAVSMTAARARAIADRHNGIGCDQLILLEPADDADAVMRIFNADGSIAEACGNASRAVALLIGRKAELITAGGRITVEPFADGATVEMGLPHFGWDEIPLAYAMDTSAMPVGWEGLSDPAAVNVGNPHLIFFVDDCDAVPLDRLGPLIENDPLFPERINVNVATLTGPNAIKLRVWERGAGLTLACGTGACATAVAAIRSKRVTSPVEVSLPGGILTIAWAGGEQITMTGPATHVFTGETHWANFD
ncbi:diaminopimelate epimerase [Sphingomonas paeninsulae]|jgi:diaminopimelate epimerase|uniref:Diaminopimelate epimerase n=1 Tax=Sphingomonas paeninsulae TaxID=2319844 RepID=A0A494TEG9_SPHPE|nr:diaminopimelate epimerase [Sphingomonas paeninsulae]AYJ85694.1 diaminopimelate epimerase [Sphingomonas paeninsulae]